MNFDKYLNITETVNYENVKENLITISKYVVGNFLMINQCLQKKILNTIIMMILFLKPTIVKQITSRYTLK